MRGIAISALVILSGCGYVGDPLPPALHIPLAVQDLSAVQRGSKLYLRFTPPQRTTEDLPITRPGEIELRLGPSGPGAFDVNAWAQNAQRLPAPEPELRADVSGFAGQEIFAAVRTQGPKGRWSDWSNVLALRIVAPLPVPALTAAAAPEGVSIEWSGLGPEGVTYRLFRQTAGQKEMAFLADVPASPFLDTAAEYGKLYKYQAQAILPTGSGHAESDLSSIIEITPQDRFPPSVPTGLSALAGVNSIELAWDRSNDSDLRGYYVYRSSGDAFARIGELTEAPAFSDRSAQRGVSYRYAVTAIDQKGNESAQSAPVEQKLP